MEALTTLIGRFHPLVVHFPIAILLMAIAFELLARIRSLKKLKNAVQPTLLIGAVTSLISVGTGLILEQEGGYDDRLLTIHKYLGFSTTAISFLVFFIRRQSLSTDKAKRKLIRLMLLIPVALLVSLTGHWGGSLTHGEQYFSVSVNDDEAASQTIRLPAVDSIHNAVMYTDVIAPILEAKCYSCHGARRQKGELRLDAKEYILRGGKNGHVLMSGAPDSSALYSRLLLPGEDKKHMPPKEKPQLSSAEIDLIHAWVGGGFSFDAKVSAFRDSDRIATYVGAIHSTQNRKSLVPSDDVSPADPGAVKQLLDQNILVVPVAQGSNYLMVNFVNARLSGNEILASLLPLKDQIIWLNLERTKVTDEGMKTVGELHRIKVLYLNNTEIGDKGIGALSKLSDLTYLNVVDTKVSDQSFPVFSDMKQLENLYVANTSFSSGAIEQFMSANKKITIDTGHYNLPVLATDTVVYKRRN